MRRPATRSPILWATLLAVTAFVSPSRASAQDLDHPESEQLEQIIVTARRYEEPLQKTPVSVIALSGDDLEDRSVTNLRDLQNSVPNLTLASSQNVGEAAGNAFIRGIGQEDFIIGSEPGVGFYVDGVYHATSRGNLINLNDIVRVEVLRGPQGTLFGRNTIGGAINIITVRPQPHREARLNLIAGSFNRAEFRGMMNEPLTERLMSRIWVSGVRRDGYLRRLSPPQPLGSRFSIDSNREGRERSVAARFQLRWLASDGVTADVSLDGARSRNTQGATKVDEIDPSAGIFPLLNQLISTGALPGPAITRDLVPDNFFATYAGGRNFSKLDSVAMTAALKGEFAVGTIDLLVAWRRLHTWMGTDNDGLYFNLSGAEFRDRQNQYSTELKMTGSRGSMTYTVGLFGLAEKAESLPVRSPVMNAVLIDCSCSVPPNRRPIPGTVHRELNSESYAVFGQGTYQLNDRLSGTLGARLTYETKTIRAAQIGSDPVTLEPTGIVEASGRNAGRWQSFTWRGGLEFQATPDLMVYGAVAKGFKAGGFNVRINANLPNVGLAPFEPETAVLYELGARSEWFRHRLRLNLTLFHTSYRDIQLRRQTVIDGVSATLIENAARARIRGLEIEMLARPAKGLTVSAAYGYLAPKYLDPGGVPGITTDSRFQRTVSHSFAGSVRYAVPVRGGTVELNGNLGYRSKEQFQLEPRPFDQDGYALVGARAAFRSDNDRWSVALFATNLTDRQFRTAGRGIAARDGVSFSSVGMPRRFGVELTSAF